MKNIRNSSALQISRIFKSEVKKQIEINRLIKVSNVSALQLPANDTRSNKNIINYFNMLKYYSKGLQIYSNFLNTYVSSWNNKSLALVLKNKNTLEGGLSGARSSAVTTSSSANASIQSVSASAQRLNTSSTSARRLSNKFINKYLKSITKFNFVPATGSNTTARRLNLFNYSQQINYNFNSLNNILIKKICNLLFSSFFSMNCIISKPVFEFKNDKIVIHLFYYLFKKELLTLEARKNKAFSILSLNKNKISILCAVLSQLFNKEVVLELNRIYYPYFDSNIFVNLLAQIINKIKLRRITKRFFLKAKMKNPFKQLNTRGDSCQALVSANLPSLLSGLHIKISGRLLTNRIIPKQTTSIISRGALAKMKVNYLDIARYTNKNKRGAFTITITSGQNLT